VILLGGMLALGALINPAAAASVPPDQDDVLVQEHLQALLRPVLAVAQDTQVQWLVRSEVMRQFDGDTEVLLSTFISEAEESMIVDPNDPDWQALKNEVAAFADINGFAHDPQIYIPNIDTGVNPGSTVTVVVAPAEDSVISVPGYQLDGYRQVVTLDTSIDEPYARTNEVWVLSVNEPADIGGAGETLQSGATGTVTGKSPARVMGPMVTCNSTGLRNNRGLEYLEQFKVPSPNSLESWIKGKLEMRVLILGTAGWEIKRVGFGKLRHTEITNWQTVDIFITTWDRAILGEVVAYQWYESDGGKQKNITVDFGPPIGNVTFQWQKRDDDAGHTLVRFTESTNIDYSTGLVNFKVCNSGGDGGTGFENFARTGITAASSTFPGYSSSRINDGSIDTNYGGATSWANAAGTYPPTTPEWVQVDFGVDKTFRRVVLYTSAAYPIRDFDVQVWNGITFVTVASVNNNTQPSLTLTFAARTSRLVRISGRSGPTDQPGFVRVNELQVFAV
jgi:hypothetical protein